MPIGYESEGERLASVVDKPVFGADLKQHGAMLVSLQMHLNDGGRER